MDVVWFVKYYSKHQDENKIVDISIFTPYLPVLLLHSTRANYIAWIWKRCLGANFVLPSIADH